MSRVVERERERQAVERINKKLTPRVIVKIGIGLLVLVAVLLGAVSFQYVWYRTTVFREQNQPSYKPQEVASPATLAGTIPITGEEPIVNTRAGARLLENPIIPNAESLEIGEDLFLTYCEPCHGRTGNGVGIMGVVPPLSRRSAKENDDLAQYLAGYMSFRPDIDINFVQNETEGEIFYSITAGGEAIMPGFKDALDVEQRWHLVNYIKTLGGSGE